MKRSRRPLKPIKKNTLKRRLKAFDLRLDRRQQRGHSPRPADETMRTCTNCGEQYKGRFCPQCGQAGSWDRFSWRRTILNFLDIWGLGNRPMFRTIMELFWRPGYMVRDYLLGHRQLYFPPFKLLAVTMALTLFINFLTGAEIDSFLGSIASEIHVEKMNLSPTLASVAQSLVNVAQFLSDHPLYEVLILVLFMVCCIRVAFRRVGDYNFVETFIFMIFVISQIYICDLFATPIKSLYILAEKQLLASSSPIMLGIGGLVSIVAELIKWAFYLFTSYLYVSDFHQFYGLTWKATIRRLLFAVFVAFLILSTLIAIGGAAYEKGIEWGVCLLLMAILFFLTYIFASSVLHRSKPVVNRYVFSLSKVTSYSLIIAMPFLSAIVSKLICGHHNVWIFLAVTLCCCALSAATAFLPGFINSRNSRKVKTSKE